MTTVEIVRGIRHGDREYEVDGLIVEEDMLEEEDGPGDLSRSTSFVTARISLSSSSWSSSSSSPPSSPAPSLTPLNLGVIGQDVEQRPSFRHFPFIFEDTYWVEMAAQGSSSVELTDNHMQAGHTRASSTPQFQQEDVDSNLHPLLTEIVLTILWRSGGYQGWNPLKLLLEETQRRRLGWVDNDTNHRKALKIAAGIHGVMFVTDNRISGTFTIIGRDIDVIHVFKTLRRKTGSNMLILSIKKRSAT